MTERSREYALAAADAAQSKKAHDVIVLDIHNISVIADYFVICTGNSRIQVQAIADGIEDRLAAAGVRCRGHEGRDEARWILLDFGDVVVHVFIEEERRLFGLERLWSEGSRILELV
ncbi:MAG: ribosome silencing factor [Firmicutes bacterium]|nr:ribosome silencing factor [Bacillota bacterium]